MADRTCMPERWVPTVGFEGYYEVSDAGRVRSKDRCTGGRRMHRGKVLKPAKTGGGYQTVHLSIDGVVSNRLVHVLVMNAFVGPKPDGLQVCHNNGDPSDNRLENLRYDTPSANAFDSVIHGTCFQSSKDECPQGHPYDKANTRLVKTPFGSGVGRQCRACDKDRQQAKRSNNRSSYNAAAVERRRRKKLAAQPSTSA